MPSDAADIRKLTPPQLARELQVTPEKVIAWIRSGELRAVNVALHAGGRPRWVIDRQDIAAFEASRASKPTPRPRRRRRQIEVEENFGF